MANSNISIPHDATPDEVGYFLNYIMHYYDNVGLGETDAIHWLIIRQNNRHLVEPDNDRPIFAQALTLNSPEAPKEYFYLEGERILSCEDPIEKRQTIRNPSGTVIGHHPAPVISVISGDPPPQMIPVSPGFEKSHVNWAQDQIDDPSPEIEAHMDPEDGPEASDGWNECVEDDCRFSEFVHSYGDLNCSFNLITDSKNQHHLEKKRGAR